MDAYSARLGLPHLNAYPAFERSENDNYGQIDQHFNAKGYALYGKFLYYSIESVVRESIAAR